MARKKQKPYFRVPKDKSLPLRYYQASITDGHNDDGTPRRIVLRSKDESVLLTKISVAKDRVAQGVNAGTTTVEKWFEFWLKEYVEGGKSPKNAAGNRTVINRHIIPIIGTKKLRDIEPGDVRRVTKAMVAKGLSSTYALNAHNIMSAAFKVAVMEQKIPKNPATLVKRPEVELAEQSALTPDESLRLLEYVAADPEYGAMWTMFLLTGARRGEVVGLEWDRLVEQTGPDGKPRTYLDMSWQLQRITWRHGCDGKCTGKRGADCPARSINVPRNFAHRPVVGGLYLTRPKTRSSIRVIPLVGVLRAVFQRHRELTEDNPYGLMFTDHGKPLDPDRVSAMWVELRDRLGLNPEVVLHGLRHTAVDMLYLADIPEDLIPEIVGHSTRTTSRGYKTRANSERLWAAMEKFDAQFMRSVDAPADKRELEAS